VLCLGEQNTRQVDYWLGNAGQKRHTRIASCARETRLLMAAARNVCSLGRGGGRTQNWAQIIRSGKWRFQMSQLEFFPKHWTKIFFKENDTLCFQ
jgi:hypothetical protein